MSTYFVHANCDAPETVPHMLIRFFSQFVELAESETSTAVASTVNKAGPQAEREEQSALRTWGE